MKNTLLCFLLVSVMIVGASAPVVAMSSVSKIWILYQRETEPIVRAEVKVIQYLLKHWSESSISTVDGKFDDVTEQAVKDFQRNKGFSMFEQDGKVDSKTWEALILNVNGGTSSSINAVKAVQQILYEKFKFRFLSVDGKSGSITKSAVCTFQNMYNLGYDGIVGINTWHTMIHMSLASLESDSGLRDGPRWYINMILPTDRSNPGTMTLYNASGSAVKSWRCLGQGSGGTDWTKVNSDTPLGVFRACLGGFSSDPATYGPYRLTFLINSDLKSPVTNNRSGILIHSSGARPNELVTSLGCIKLTGPDHNDFVNELSKFAKINAVSSSGSVTYRMCDGLIFISDDNTPPVTTFNVTFDADNGTDITVARVNGGEKVPIPVDPAKDGFVFIGWYSESDMFDFNMSISEDIALTAKWRSLYSRGDIDGDGAVTMLDLMILFDHLAGMLTLTSEQMYVADIDIDGNVTMADLMRMFNYLSGACTDL